MKRGKFSGVRASGVIVLDGVVMDGVAQNLKF
jgi:hypothetical protein